MSSYKIDDRNRVKRVPYRGQYDKQDVYDVLDAGMVCHMGFVADGQPFVIPTLYGREGDTIYVHGSVKSRLMLQLEANPQVCITVTHIDGLVLARSAFHHSMNYRSAVVFGKARKVADADKNHALTVISENMIPGRWDEARPPTEKELRVTTVLAVDIEQASAKVREGGPVDDKEDYELPIWAGVLPLNLVPGAPIADEKLTEGIPVAKSVEAMIE